jgi:hypothetical protein
METEQELIRQNVLTPETQEYEKEYLEFLQEEYKYKQETELDGLMRYLHGEPFDETFIKVLTNRQERKNTYDRQKKILEDKETRKRLYKKENNKTKETPPNG